MALSFKWTSVAICWLFLGVEWNLGNEEIITFLTLKKTRFGVMLFQYTINKIDILLTFFTGYKRWERSVRSSRCSRNSGKTDDFLGFFPFLRTCQDKIGQYFFIRGKQLPLKFTSITQRHPGLDRPLTNIKTFKSPWNFAVWFSCLRDH